MSNDTIEHPSAAWLVTGLLVLTLVIRGSALWAMRANLQNDPDAYRQIAENLLRHGEFAATKGDQIRPTAFRPPLYPVVLSNLPDAGGQGVSLVKIALLHLALGMATVWLTWLTCRHWLTGLAPLLAGFLVACDPILLNQQSLVMTETLAAFLAILSLWCLFRFDATRSWFNAALAGGAIGLAVLCRPTFLPWLALVAVAMLVVLARPFLRLVTPKPALAGQSANQVRPRFEGLGTAVAIPAAMVIAAALVMSPWVIRNQREFDHPIVTTTHGGYTLMLGNNNSFYYWLTKTDRAIPWKATTFDRVLDDEHWYQINPDQAHAEMHRDRFCYWLARNAMRQQPWDCARASIYRVGQLWSPLPNQLTANESTARRMLRYTTCAWYCGVYALAAVGVWRLRWKLLHPPWIWGLLLCLAFTAIHTFYWTNLRMCAPLMPFIAILAAAGCPLLKFSPKTEN